MSIQGMLVLSLLSFSWRNKNIHSWVKHSIISMEVSTENIVLHSVVFNAFSWRIESIWRRKGSRGGFEIGCHIATRSLRMKSTESRRRKRIGTFRRRSSMRCHSLNVSWPSTDWGSLGHLSFLWLPQFQGSVPPSLLSMLLSHPIRT